MGPTPRQVATAIQQYREAGHPLAGAMRVASLNAARGDEKSIPALFAAALAAHKHNPTWAELRALVEASQALVPRLLVEGERLFSAREPSKGFYILHEGVLVVTPGDINVGPMTVLGAGSAHTRSAYRCTVTAAAPAVVLHLATEDVVKLFAACPFAREHLVATAGATPDVGTVTGG